MDCCLERARLNLLFRDFEVTICLFYTLAKGEAQYCQSHIVSGRMCMCVCASRNDFK